MLYGSGGGACQTDAAQSLNAASLNTTMAEDPSSSIIEDGGDFEWVDNPGF